MKQDAIKHGTLINEKIMKLMEEVNDLGIEIAYNGALDGAPDWIDEVLSSLEAASDYLENNMDLDESVEFGDLDEDDAE